MTTRRMCGLLLACATSTVAAQSLEERVSALESRLGGTQVEVGGYVKVDVMSTRLGDGEVADNAVLRDHLIVSQIPVGGRASRFTDFSAQESRLWLKTATPTAWGELKTHIEMDFMTQGMGNESVSNSYAPRLRHAYLSFNGWLLGQTWTTFFDAGALPDLLDFVGPVGATFGRQAQVRYSTAHWDLALENPHTDLAGNPGSSDRSRWPDLIARYRFSVGASQWSASALVRELRYESSTLGNESKVGYGASVAGRVPVGEAGSDLRLQLMYGNAAGRYMGLAAFPSGIVDPVDGDLALQDLMAATVAYRHVFNRHWRSNLAASLARADLPRQAVPTAAERYRTLHLNLIYSPVSRLDLGVEVLYADRRNEDGAEGDMARLQFSGKLMF